ncbi:MAG: hypothetical protein J6C53_03060 [Clostridia bacterium]|nr:hypothetical protein [Clostridia bacterium]
MTKSEYIQKLKNLILQRVNFHAPKPRDSEIDYSVLNIVGIDASYPIFIFKKPLNEIFYKAFSLAKQEVEFNLILTEKPLVKAKNIKKLSKTFVFSQEEMGGMLLLALENLNINYLSHATFDKIKSKEYIKIAGQELNFDFLPYFKRNNAMFNGVLVESKKFLLNGKNVIINLANTKLESREVDIEINIPLPRGYYFFKQSGNCVEIKNLTTMQKAYFNFNLPCEKLSFSLIGGIESCTFAGINLKCKVCLLPKQTLKLYYNFGDKKYCFSSPKEVELFFNLSQQKANEIFDVKVQTRDIKFDDKFNRSLPREIWEKWEKFDIDEASENLWLKIRSQIIKLTPKGEQISRDFKGLKEVKMYRNLGWKRVFVLRGEANYLFANKIKYFNYNLLTKEIFAKNNEIYLSFAD